jgi:hypothetical protein
LTSPRTPAIREGNRAGHWRVMHASNASLSGAKHALIGMTFDTVTLQTVIRP